MLIKLQNNFKFTFIIFNILVIINSGNIFSIYVNLALEKNIYLIKN